jgi:hypothetical protein
MSIWSTPLASIVRKAWYQSESNAEVEVLDGKLVSHKKMSVNQKMSRERRKKMKNLSTITPFNRVKYVCPSLRNGNQGLE